MFKGKKFIIANIVLALVFLFTSCSSSAPSKIGLDKVLKNKIQVDQKSNSKPANATVNPATALDTSPVTKPASKSITKPANKVLRTIQQGISLKVYFLDVGQADSILITSDGASMLIDAGNNADGPGVVEYLKEKEIKKLDYVIGTHPHEDHVGGLDDVIDNFQIGKIIMPNVTSTTKTFKDVISAESRKGLTTTAPKVGAIYTLKYAKFEILSPNGTFGDTNENSVVIRLVFKSESFLFCGDADNTNEDAMLNSGEVLNSDVIKIGHHGSATSSELSFLRAVTPEYAVISVGEGNSYGHPTQTALSAIASVGAKLYRTDKDGTIIFSTDGSGISVSKDNTSIDGSSGSSGSLGSSNNLSSGNSSNSGSNSNSGTNKGATVYVTSSGAKYHRAGCQYLSKSKISISLADAKKSYTPCKRCNPPK